MTMWLPKKLYDIGEAMTLLDPRFSDCVTRLEYDFEERRLIVECTLPLDVETAIGLQIVGDRAVADPDLDLIILVSLKGKPEE